MMIKKTSYCNLSTRLGERHYQAVSLYGFELILSCGLKFWNERYLLVRPQSVCAQWNMHLRLITLLLNNKAEP